MLLDQTTVLSDKQAVTSSAASTHTVDTTAGGNAVPGALFAVLRTDTAFAGATQIVFTLQTADDSTFTAPKALLSATFTGTELGNANKVLFAQPVPAGIKRYLRAYYTVTGTVTAGAVSCFLTDAVDQK